MVDNRWAMMRDVRPLSSSPTATCRRDSSLERRPQHAGCARNHFLLWRTPSLHAPQPELRHAGDLSFPGNKGAAGSHGVWSQLHAAIARAIEQSFADVVEAQPETLAHHLTEAGLPNEAAGFWLRA